MKIKKGYMLHQLGEDYIAINLDKDTHEDENMIKINSTGEFLWRLLENGAEKEDLIKEICKNYEGATEEVVTKDVEEFLNIIKPALE